MVQALLEVRSRSHSWKSLTSKHPFPLDPPSDLGVLAVVAIVSAVLLLALADGSQADGLAVELRGIRGAELASGDLVGEEDVQFTVGPSLGFGEAEVRPRETERVEAEPEEAGLGPPVPCGGVEHVRGDDAVDDPEHVVDVAREHDGLGAETGGGQFGDEGIADGPDGQIIWGRESVKDARPQDGMYRGGHLHVKV